MKNKRSYNISLPIYDVKPSSHQADYICLQFEFQRRLQDAGITNVNELEKLRAEVEQLREQLQRPGQPQRSQTLDGGEPNAQVL